MAGPYDIVCLPGDGIGPEVMAQAELVLKATAEIFGLDLRFESIPCGGKYYLETGRQRDWPEGSAQRCRSASALLLAAVGWPDPEGRGPVTMRDGKMAGYSPVIGNRVELDLYANVRPVELFEGVGHIISGRPSQVWLPKDVNMSFVRENTEDLYCSIGGTLRRGGSAELAIDDRIVTRKGSERVIRRAFELCKLRGRGAPRDGKRRVTAIVKDNVMEGCRLFRDIFFEVGAEFPEIEKETVIVDAFTQFLLREPERYDVLVTTNLFGDVVTDLASVLQGGMGLAVGCNLGDGHGMFEPIHGSAPPLAGKDKANPLAMILAAKEMLEWLGQRHGDQAMLKGGEAIERAAREQVKAGVVLTEDLIGPGKASGCRAVGSELVRRIQANA